MPKEQLENFDKFAVEYKSILDESIKLGGEKGDYFTAYKANYLARCVGSKFSGRILDYGCGVGLLSEVLYKKFPQSSIDGFDVSEASLECVPNYLRKQGRFTSNLNSLHQKYDVIVLSNVLHHIQPPHRQMVIDKLKSFLGPKGILLIFEHNPYNPVTRKIVRESPLDKGVLLLPLPETSSYLQDAHLTHIKYDFIVFFPKPLSFLRWAEPFLSRLPLGAQYVIQGQA